MINFVVSPDDQTKILKIAQRAHQDLKTDILTIEMDLCACHANGNPLNLDKLLAAPPFDFAHDIYGINRHIDHETGELSDNFSPRCTR